MAAGRQSRRFLPAVALGGLATLIVLGFVLALIYGREHLTGNDIFAWVEELGPWGPLAVVALMIVHCFVPFPAEILALCAGMAYGTAAGSALIWTGAMIGAALSFGLARAVGRDVVERLLPARHRAALDGWTADRGASTLLVVRFIPVIAFNLINYAAGLTRVGWWTFLWTTAAGILPLTVLMVHLGARMRELSWPLLLAVSGAGILAVWGFHTLRERQGRGSERRSRPPNPAGTPDRPH